MTIDLEKANEIVARFKDVEGAYWNVCMRYSTVSDMYRLKRWILWPMALIFPVLKFTA